MGLDASRTMLAQGASQAAEGNLAYLRGDAENLPFRAGSFDAVCCFAALYLIERPLKAVEEIVRVLAPGGRVALLASVQRGPLPAGVANLATRPLTGVRIFGRDELTGALAEPRHAEGGPAGHRPGPVRVGAEARCGSSSPDHGRAALLAG